MLFTYSYLLQYSLGKATSRNDEALSQASGAVATSVTRLARYNSLHRGVTGVEDNSSTSSRWLRFAMSSSSCPKTKVGRGALMALGCPNQRACNLKSNQREQDVLAAALGCAPRSVLGSAAGEGAECRTTHPKRARERRPPLPRPQRRRPERRVSRHGQGSRGLRQHSPRPAVCAMPRQRTRRPAGSLRGPAGSPRAPPRVPPRAPRAAPRACVRARLATLGLGRTRRETRLSVSVGAIAGCFSEGLLQG